MSSDVRRVTIDDVPIEFTVRTSEEATQPRIDVGIHDITVTIPSGESIDPEVMLQEHLGWVLEKKAKFDNYRSEAPQRDFEEGEIFPYLGEPHEVVIERRSASDIVNGEIRLAAHHAEQTSIQQSLERLYRRKARERIEETVEQYSKRMGLAYDKLEIRNQRTKWGSCSSSGTLGLNWRLIMAPPEILEYVVIHELAHLEEANHNDEFWSIVSEYDSEYRQHAEWLEENSTKLIFTEKDL